jgi:hypothetical protein
MLAAPEQRKLPGGSHWLWPPRPFAVLVAACLLAIAFLASIPAFDVPHAGLEEETYGLHFGIVRAYEHGWPLRYSRRKLPDGTIANEAQSPWRPWQRVDEWSTFGLIINLAFWGLLILATAIAAQYWRSRRQAIWQLDLRDLLALTGAAGLVFAWLAASRAEYNRERALLAEFRERNGNPQMQHEVGASVPAWWPDWLQERYRAAFNRTCLFRSNGDSDLACQHRHLVTLRETEFHPQFARHLRQIPGLEALDLSYTNLPYFDVTRQATILRSLKPLPNLRGINLYGTNATDADMEWLGGCQRLEVIDLSDTDIGDHGLAHLAALPNVRVLRIGSDRVSDRGCRSLASMSAMEALSLASRNVKDAGVIELAKLRKLRRLQLSTRANDAAYETLRKELPRCKLDRRSY